MTEPVKRYVTTCDCMSEAVWGDYVRHEDYTRLEQECERLRLALNDAAKSMHWIQSNTPMSKRIAATLAKARLAAELAALSTNATIPADVTPR